MPIDYNKLLNKIVPQPDGESELRVRTGVISVVNANGTVDLTLSGAVFPGVPVLDGVGVAVGAVVQVLSARGYLLVLGGSSAGGGARAVSTSPNSTTTASTTYTPLIGANIQSLVFRAPASGQVKITIMGWLGVSHTSIATRSWLSGQVREGDVGNTGTIVNAADDGQAGMSQNSTTAAFDYKYVNTSYVVPSLVPGAAYNVTSMVRTVAGTVGTQDRRIIVEPF